MKKNPVLFISKRGGEISRFFSPFPIVVIFCLFRIYVVFSSSPSYSLVTGFPFTRFHSGSLLDHYY